MTLPGCLKGNPCEFAMMDWVWLLMQVARVLLRLDMSKALLLIESLTIA